LGVRPLLGRNIEPSDAENGGHSVVVLNYRFWQRHFGGDPHVIGRTLEINRAPYTIVGVMPRSFAFNDSAGVGDLYLPGSLTRNVPNVLSVDLPWIKLRPHVTLAAANAALEPIVLPVGKGPERDRWRLALEPMIAPFQQETGHTLTLLLGGVVLLLIVGCANCSILLLARGRSRQHELAIRSAIGASRWRIVRQLLIEAVVISCAGAALGVAASYWLAKLPLLLSPDSFPAESVIRINAPILAFSVALALLCGILFGLLPALRLSRHDGARMLPGRGVAAAPARHRWSVLIAAQVALTLLLMATAGTAVHSFLRIMQMPLGYDPANVMKFGIGLHIHDAGGPSGPENQRSSSRRFFPAGFSRIPRRISATVNEDINRSSSDCSAIHATSASDGAGFVTLPMMFVSSRLRLTAQSCGPKSVGASDPDRRRPEATGVVHRECRPFSTLPPKLSGGQRRESATNRSRRPRAALRATGSVCGRRRAQGPQTGPSPAG